MKRTPMAGPTVVDFANLQMKLSPIRSPEELRDVTRGWKKEGMVVAKELTDSSLV